MSLCVIVLAAGMGKRMKSDIPKVLHPVLGRPMLYGTTRKFLEVFGLNSLKDLPKIEELKKPNA